jgi:O-antigen/teichoic acid export membrane protein
MRRLLAMTMIQRGLAVAVYTAATMILARLLTPEQVGIFSLGAAFLAVASVVREFGITEFLMQDKALDRNRIRAAYGVAIVVGWSMGAAILLLRQPIARFYGEPGVAQVLAVMALNYAFLPFATPTTALLYRDMGIGRVLWIQTVALVIGHVASIAMAWTGMGYMALAWGAVVNSVCMVVMLLWTRRDALQYSPTLAGSGPIWSYCGKFSVSGVFEQVGANVHEFIIGRRFGFAALGLYSRANGLFVQFNQNIARGISRVLLPNFARQAREGSGDLRADYRATLRLYTAFVWPMYALAAVMAPEIVDVMFGRQWAQSAPLLRLLCIGAIIQAGYAFASELLGAMGQAGARLRINSLGTPLWAVLCVIGSLFSLRAIALAFALQAAIVLMLYLRQLQRLIGFTWRDFAAATWRSALVAAAVGAAGFAAQRLLTGEVAGSFVVLAIVSLLATGAWAGAAFLCRHPVAIEIAAFARLVAARVSRN